MKRLERFGNYLESIWNAKRKKDGAELVFNCPVCGDTKGHFSFNIDLGVSNCFRCGYNPRPRQFLKSWTTLSDIEINELLEFYEHKEVKVKERYLPVLPSDFKLLNDIDYGKRILIQHWAMNNGFTMNELSNYGIGVSDSYRNMLIVPCWNKGHSELLFWFGRSFLSRPEFLKYYFPGEKSGALWGMEFAELIAGQLFVCEGWKDAARMKGVCVFGNSISYEQMKKVKQLKKQLGGDRIAIMLDSDAWIKGYQMATKFLQIEERVMLYLLKNKKDPGECKDYREVLENSEYYELPDGMLKALFRIEQERMKI